MRKVQVRGEIGPDVANGPVASSKTRKLKRTTTVRMNVARSEPMFSTPIFAKIAVSAANTADSTAHTCQDSKLIQCPFPQCGCATSSTQNVNSTEAYQEYRSVWSAFPIPRLT